MSRIITASVICLIQGYLLGSLSFSIIISRLLKGEDIRTYGSKSAGMTNMLRTYGKKYALMCGIGDFSKGLLAVLIGRLIFSLFGVGGFDPGYISGAAAVIGHMFPVFFKFKGGKGVLTGLGVLVSLNPLAFLIVLAVALPIIYFSRIVSLASIIGAIVYPFASFIVRKMSGKPLMLDTIFSVLVALTIIYMHRSNIVRLIKGTEYRFSKKEK